jgi:hypothetical protein
LSVKIIINKIEKNKPLSACALPPPLPRPLLIALLVATLAPSMSLGFDISTANLLSFPFVNYKSIAL